MSLEFIKLFPLFSIITAFISVVLCSLFQYKRARMTAFIAEFLCLLFGIGVLIYAVKYGDTVIQMGHLTRGADGEPYYWYNNVIRFGLTEGVFVTAFPPILFFCILGGTRKLRDDLAPDKEKLFYVLSSLVLVALLALVYADDIFTGYVFLEISTLASIGLIAVKEKGRTTVAAIRYMIFNLVGSGFYLIGIVLLYDLTGYFMLEKIHESLSALAASGGYITAIACPLALITIGLGIKSGLFPFHFWMADTYGESTTASAGIISGLISKGYIILLLKIYGRTVGFEIAEQTGITNIVFALGVGGMIFGSVSAIFEKRINKMIAYSSAAQIGYIYLAIGLGKAGIVPAVLQILVHAITKPLLFLSARGLIEVSDHRPQFKFLRGSGKRNPFASCFFAFGALSMVGFPLTAGFTVKYLFLETALVSTGMSAKLWITVIALALSTLLNTVYFIHTAITLFVPYTEKAELSEESENHKNYFGYKFSVISLALMNIFLGISPWLVSVLQNSNCFGL